MTIGGLPEKPWDEIRYLKYGVDSLGKPTNPIMTASDRTVSREKLSDSVTLSLLDELMDLDWTTLCPIALKLLASPSLSVEVRTQLLTHISSYQLLKLKGSQ